MFVSPNSNFSVSQHDASSGHTAGLRGVYLIVRQPGIGWYVTPTIEFAPFECKFIAEAPMLPQTSVCLQFALPRRNLVQQFDGVVHWCRNVKDSWHVGALLSEPFEHAFAEAMGEDSRVQLRYEINRPVTLRVVGSDDEYPAMLLDYSMSGASFCICGQNSHLKNRQVDLIFDDGSTGQPFTTAQIAWSVPGGSDYHFVGAHMSNADRSWFFSLSALDNASEPAACLAEHRHIEE